MYIHVVYFPDSIYTPQFAPHCATSHLTWDHGDYLSQPSIVLLSCPSHRPRRWSHSYFHLTDLVSVPPSPSQPLAMTTVEINDAVFCQAHFKEVVRPVLLLYHSLLDHVHIFVSAPTVT